MSAVSAVPRRPDLADQVLARGASLGETPVESLRPLVNECLQALRDAGAHAGTVVAVEEGAAPRFLASVLAAWTLDAVPLPCRSAAAVPLCAGAYIVDVGGRVHEPRERVEWRGLESTAVLHVTSGSTSAPKLARRGCASVLGEATGYRLGLSLGPRDRVYTPVPLAHSYGWGVAIGALLAGACLDAVPLTHARRGAVRLKAATVAAITAPIASLLASVPRIPGEPGGIPRIVMVGASRVTAQIDDAFHARFGVRLARNYGSSETGATLIGAAGLPEGAVGLPMHGNIVVAPEPGEEGELRIALPPVEGCIGAASPPTRHWSTGDLVRRDVDGTVIFVARLRAATRVNDRNVDVHGLEQAIRGCANVEDVFSLVLSRPDGHTEDLYAVVAGDAVDRDSIRRGRGTWPDGTRSARLIYCEQLPLLATGKVDRARVIEIIKAQIIKAQRSGQ